MNNLIDLATSKPLLSLSLISFILLSYILNRIGRREKDLPPGPPTLPIIGNLHQIPLSQPYIKFTEWSKEFGEIYSLKLGPSTMIVLNDAKSVKDLLDGKSGVYSDRAPHWVGRHLITNNNNMLMVALSLKILRYHILIIQISLNTVNIGKPYERLFTVVSV